MVGSQSLEIIMTLLSTMSSKKSMITLLLILMNVAAPVEGRVDGVFCDDIMETIWEYQDETGAFSESQLQELTGGCLRWEEREAEIEAK